MVMVCVIVVPTLRRKSQKEPLEIQLPMLCTGTLFWIKHLIQGLCQYTTIFARQLCHYYLRSGHCTRSAC